MWEKVFQYKRKEYPNLLILAGLVMCLSGSNSTVERAFSLLTLMLTDRRLSLAHNTIENILIINANDKLWTPLERESIIKSAAEKYENAKRRVRKLADDPNPSQAKVPRIEIEDNEESASDYYESESESDTEEEEE